MTIAHRLGDEWLLAYAAGTLSEGQSVLVASHLSFLPDAATDLRMAERLGGVLMDELPPTEMSSDALDRLMDRLDALPQEEEDADDRQRDHAPVRTEATLVSATRDEGPSIFPAAVQPLTGRDPDKLTWRFLGPGLKQSILWRGENGEKLWLIRGKPGARIPRHAHMGEEMTLVLQGGYQDQHGHYLPGDIEERNGDESHAIKVDTDGECIALIFTQGRLKFDNWKPRLIQPFLGI